MAWEITADELLERYAAGECNFAGVDLNPGNSIDRGRVRLSRWDWVDKIVLDLSGINLRGANLFRVELSRCNLSGADLFGACLKNSGLAFSDLRNVNLRGAYMYGTVLKGADLTYANLTNAILIDANLTNVECDWSIWVGTNMTNSEPGCVCYRDATLIWHTILPGGDIDPGPYFNNC